MPDAIPYFKPGQDFLALCNQAGGVSGKRFVMVNANQESGPGLSATGEGSNYKVGYPSAGGAAIGVAKYDAVQNAKIGVMRGGIVPVTASGAIAAGGPVKADATGKAVAQGGTGIILGYAMSGCADTEDCQVALALS